MQRFIERPGNQIRNLTAPPRYFGLPGLLVVHLCLAPVLAQERPDIRKAMSTLPLLNKVAAAPIAEDWLVVPPRRKAAIRCRGATAVSRGRMTIAALDNRGPQISKVAASKAALATCPMCPTC